jgi:hypothetical protein
MVARDDGGGRRHRALGLAGINRSPESRYPGGNIQRDLDGRRSCLTRVQRTHALFYILHPKHAIHGTLNTQRLGSAGSHGCVRLAPRNAQKLYSLVREYGVAKTTVVLTGDVKLSLSAHTQPGARKLATGNESIAEVLSRLDQDILVQPP